MAIVPSGKRKLMKLQQSYNVTDEDGAATQSEVSNDQSAAAPAVDWSALQKGVEQPQGQKPAPSPEEIGQAAQGGKMDPNADPEKNGMEGLGGKGDSIRMTVFQTLKQLGAPERLIMDNPDSFFKGEKDLDTGTLTGSYYLPTHTHGRQITEQDAEKIALQIGSQFGLSQKIAPVGRNFKVDFRTRDMPSEDYGTSLQDLANGGGGGGKGKPSQPMARAASSEVVKSKMKKARIDSMFEKLRETGFGG